jgi:NAD(P)-dependent dehydrogenase (short-subunit alcohol dehydrogenase family)
LPSLAGRLQQPIVPSDSFKGGATSLGDRASYVTADVSEEVDARRYVDAAVDTFGRLDIAFLNAGIAGTVARIEETPVDLRRK